MATTTMGDSTPRSNSRMWWGIAVVAAIILAVMLMSRSPRDSETTSGSSAIRNSQGTTGSGSNSGQSTGSGNSSTPSSTNH